jgi:DNA (cytosine-5)-methyltransferase 1
MFSLYAQFNPSDKEDTSGSASPPACANVSTCGELFAGCGAMAAGIAQAGFKHEWLLELNSQACETLRGNLHKRQDALSVILLEQDVRQTDWSQVASVDLLAGGPPCQPFSTGGLSRGEIDPRDMWPETLRAVRNLRPRGFLFENVKGLLRPSFAEYLKRILNALEHGGCEEHGAPAMYEVAVIAVNTADYGAPQKRAIS